MDLYPVGAVVYFLAFLTLSVRAYARAQAKDGFPDPYFLVAATILYIFVIGAVTSFVWPLGVVVFLLATYVKGQQNDPTK